MKIKQHGTIPEWKLDVTCKNCNAIITLEGAKDMYAKSHPTGKMDGIYVDYGPRTFHCTCPECGKEICEQKNNFFTHNKKALMFFCIHFSTSKQKLE